MRNRRLIATIGSIAMVLGLVALAAPVQAHTNVKDSNPKDGVTIDALPEEAWVQFGNANLPQQPGAISDGYLEVFDACRNRVDEGDTMMSTTADRLTVAVTEGAAGRYEIHWHVTAADGAEQAGVIDFLVGAAKPCKAAVAEDAAEDIDLGVDIVQLKTKMVSGGTKVRLKVAKFPKCRSFGESEVMLLADTNYNDAVDLNGTYACDKGKFSVDLANVDESGEADDEHLSTLKVTRKGKKLFFKFPNKLLGAEEHLDLFVEVSTDSEECDAETSCFDRAPDLGALRAL